MNEKVKKLRNLIVNKIEDEWENALSPHADGFYEYIFLYLIFKNVPNDQTELYGKERFRILFDNICRDIVDTIKNLYTQENLEPIFIQYLKNMHFIYRDGNERVIDVSFNDIKNYIINNFNYSGYETLFRKKFEENFNKQEFESFIDAFTSQLLYYIIYRIK